MKFKSILFLFFVLSNAVTWAGVDFFAINLPASLQNEIGEVQRYLKNRLPRNSFSATPKENMHITLKVVADLNQQQRHVLRTPIRNWAKRQRRFRLKSAIRGARLKVSKGGVVMLNLKKSDNLTNLAQGIERQVKSLRNLNATINSRMDFPYKGHITIGKIEKRAASKISELSKKFKNSLLKGREFELTEFVLLKSNKPQKPRKYEYKGKFPLR